MEEKKERVLKINLRCNDPDLAKKIVLDHYPDAFCQTTSNGWTKRKEFTIQQLTHKLNDPDGEYREDIGCTADTEEQAWLFAADNVLREQEKLSGIQ